MVSMIVAMDMNRAIGRGNTLPWQIKEDLRYFSKITKNKVVVMGKKTYESIGRLLPNRTNVIITRDEDFRVKEAFVFNDIEDVLHAFKSEEIFIIGGGQIYEAFLPYAQTLYITLIDLYLEEADTYFPSYEEDFEQLIRGQENYSEEQDCLYSFNLWKRK